MIQNKKLSFESVIPAKKPKAEDKGIKILVTGATGFLGSRLVEVLIQRGYQVRALARKSSNIDKLIQLGVEIFFGDVGSKASMKPAFEGVDVVIHAAATSEGDIRCFEDTNIKGTENVFKLASQEGIKRIVYISSMSVYQICGLRKGTMIDEDGTFELKPKERGFYSYSKMESERLVQEFIQSNELPTVILRPATIYGPGGPIITPMIGISVFDKLFVTLGKSSMRLPLVHIDNLIDAILLSMEKEEVIGEVFNVIDDESVSKKEYIKDYIKTIFPKSRSLFLPYWFVYLLVFTQEVLFKLMGKAPVFTRYSLTSAINEVSYDNSKAKTKLSWKPKISLKEGLERSFTWFRANL